MENQTMKERIENKVVKDTTTTQDVTSFALDSNDMTDTDQPVLPKSSTSTWRLQEILKLRQLIRKHMRKSEIVKYIPTKTY
jgi:hypothetical protein